MSSPDPMTPEFSRDLAEVRMSPYWLADEDDGMARRNTFIEQASEYATYEEMPGDLKAIFQAAQAQLPGYKHDE